MKRLIASLTAAALLTGTAVLAQQDAMSDAPAKADAAVQTMLDNPTSKASYAIGVQLGREFSKSGLELDPDAFAQAIKDVNAGGDMLLSDEEMQGAIQELQAKLMQQQQEDMAKKEAERGKLAAQGLEEANAFLETNRTEEGVKETESGLQYEVIEEGSGESPGATDSVRVHYHGTLIDGTVFDSSVDRGEPIVFPVNRVIEGWQEALQMMKEGAKYRLYIPPGLAYGEMGSPPAIKPNSLLIFDVELLEVVDQKQQQTQEDS